MPRRRPVTTALLAVAAAVLAGCSPSSEAAIEANPLIDEFANDPVEPIGPGAELLVDSFEWGFEVIEGVAVDGPIELTLNNIGEATHNIRFDQAAGETNLVQAGAGEQATDTIQLFGAPGGAVYTYYCDIAGHRANGMEGTLTVYLTPEDAAEATGEAVDTVEDEEAAEEEPSEEPVEEEPTEEPEADPADELVAGEVTEDDIAALDDSDDVAGALDGRGSARLYAVTFDSGSSTLSADASDVLDDLAAWLENNTAEAVRIEGNTDSAGDADGNLTLSEERAAAVIAALVERGVDEDRLSALGNGETNLLVDPDEGDDVAQQINRRVEVFVAG